MHATRRSRPLLTVLALIALLLAPWPAQAAPIVPFDSFTGWLADLWAKAGLILDPNGVAGGEPVSIPTEGLILDPDGGASVGGGGTPPAGSDSVDVGLILDPSGRYAELGIMAAGLPRRDTSSGFRCQGRLRPARHGEG